MNTIARFCGLIKTADHGCVSVTPVTTAAPATVLARGLFNAFIDSTAGTKRADEIELELIALCAATPSPGAAKARELAAKIDSVPADEPARVFILRCINLFAKACDQADDGPERDDFDAAGGQLWAAFKKKWPG